MEWVGGPYTIQTLGQGDWVLCKSLVFHMFMITLHKPMKKECGMCSELQAV